MLTTFYIVALLVALFLRAFNAFNLFQATHRFEYLRSPTYSFLASDIPRELPGDYPDVTLVFGKDDSTRYPLNDSDVWSTLWPGELGLVRLGPEGRLMGISMYHQLHCLNSVRHAYMVGRSNLDGPSNTPLGHNTHCLHFIRQSILCHADLTLIPVDEDRNTEDEAHRCRDWSKVRAFAEKNQAAWQGVPMDYSSEG
ncbi:hypothetical protein CPB84DRAFT_1713073 [Gymnopilus junonius]|uniref:Oxidase ustYa n=1 Tax=Gymnopilus junonius TaxID=109634 RepID=A0A9P5TIA6_GYMJU|nr:hypothetical protein CPB84DRAFT_1713073 [Gymnopilus junonius]